MTTVSAPVSNTERIQDTTKRKKGFFRNLLSFVMLSLLLSVFIELMGMTFIWPELGSTHATSMAEKELSFLNQDFVSSVTGAPPALFIAKFVNGAYYWLFEFTRIEKALLAIGGWIGLLDYVVAFQGVVVLFLTRLGILLLSVPLFLLFFIVGANNGLCLRDIRRWGGGREYGRVHHIAKKYAPKVFFLAWLIYLSLPVSIHPNFIVFPCALALGINATVLASTYKKYL